MFQNLNHSLLLIFLFNELLKQAEIYKHVFSVDDGDLTIQSGTWSRGEERGIHVKWNLSYATVWWRYLPLGHHNRFLLALQSCKNRFVYLYHLPYSSITWIVVSFFTDACIANSEAKNLLVIHSLLTCAAPRRNGSELCCLLILGMILLRLLLPDACRVFIDKLVLDWSFSYKKYCILKIMMIILGTPASGNEAWGI